MARKRTVKAKPPKQNGRPSISRPRNGAPVCLLTSGKPYDFDDLEDPDNSGVFGRSVVIAPNGPCDDEGLPLTTLDEARSQDYLLEHWELECRWILKKYGCDPLPTDPLPSPVPGDATEQEKDAYRFVRSVRCRMKRYREGDFAGAIIHATDVGQIAQRIMARAADPLVDWRHARIADARRGGRRTEPEHLAKWSRWRMEAAELRKQYPSENRSDIAKRIHFRHSHDELRAKPGTIRKKIAQLWD